MLRQQAQEFNAGVTGPTNNTYLDHQLLLKSHTITTRPESALSEQL